MGKKYKSVFFIEENKYIFEVQDIRLAFSNPSMQLFNEDEKTYGKNIMYFYYTVEIFTKDYENSWNLLTTTRTCDFPSIFCKKYFKKVINYNVEKNEHYIYKENDKNKRWEKEFEFGNDYFVEDKYIIKKIKEEVWQYNKNVKHTWYNLFIGCSNMSRTSVSGVWINFLNRKNIKTLNITMDKFVKYAINKENEYLEKTNEKKEV